MISYAIKKSELTVQARKDMANKLLVVIGGPTGIGKTNVAIHLALHYRTEIISADSRQIYKELRIGVGRPSPVQLEAVPHHMIGHATIFKHYTAGHYAREALQLLENLFKVHDIVILTGGTGLYVKSIIEGLDDMPEVPFDITDRLTTYWKEHGTSSLIKRLELIDPEFLRTVDTSNHIRLIRAIAVSEYSGRPFSSFRKGHTVSRPFHILPVVLDSPRDELYARIDQRVFEMMDEGWLDEARALYPYRHLKALQTVGYKELFEFLEEKRSLPETVVAIQQATRRYAKRQITWWRHQGVWQRFSPDQVQSIIKAIEKHRV